ncbi:MAG: RecQ family ATP-dependent DNA helicase [Lachnospiraceae bacterium]|nr:RecQ family ATP-dependent DNA helicase [Lachnospiraceae bacterium]
MKADKFNILKNYFGYDSFREGQELLIDSILAGRDVLGIMPTGAGKSICYQVPALLFPGITIVVSPLISLMADQVKALNQAGVHAAYINSSLSEGQISKALRFAAEGRYKIVYAAPERLETFEFLQFARRVELSMLTVDEAHCISQWGQDFRPSYLKIVQFVRQLPKRPVISAFTATATEAVKEDIACVLGLADPRVLVTGFDRKNLYFSVETLGRQREKDEYILNYVKEHSGDSGLIYCATRKNVESVYELLAASGVPAVRYHAGLESEERRRNQEDFTYDRKPVMVATNAFGMGIDKSNIRYVIHYNMPQSMENYYQEAGRAGRDGEASECILLYSAQDIMINRFLMEQSAKEREEQDKWKEESSFAQEDPHSPEDDRAAVRERDEARLQQMQHYCTTKSCLRMYILNYFGEHGSRACGNCSNCQREFEEVDVTEEAGKIVECVLEMRQRFGINVIAGTLSGSVTAKLREYNAPACRMYGSLAGWPEGEIKELIGQLVEEGILTQTKDKYALLKVTAGAKELMDGGKAFILRRAPRKEKTEQGRRPGRTGSASGRRSDILNSRGLELFELLRQLRMEIAKEENVPPYVVFTDKTLTEMCIRLPLAENELRAVSGIGESRCRRYGERFLDRIRAFTGGERPKLYFGELQEVLGIPGGAGARRTTAGDAESAGTGIQGKESVGIGSGKAGSARKPKAEFFLTPGQLEDFPYKEGYLLPELAAALSERRDPETVKKLTGAEIFRFLQKQGCLEEKYVDGQWKKIVLEEGQRAGLYCAPRMSRGGTEYEAVYCNERAQRMIAEYFTRQL